MQLKPVENIDVVKATKINPADKFIGFISVHRDSPTEKMIDEYVPYFLREGYNILFSQDSKCEDMFNYAPRHVVLFRAGQTVDPEVSNRLAMFVDKIKHYGIRVTYYVDDFSVVMQNNGFPLYLASKCDAVITPTSSLKEYIIQTQVNVPVIVVPTHIDIPTIDNLDPVPEIKNINKFKVLLASGGRVGAIYLRAITEIMNSDPDRFKDVLLIVNSQGVAQMRTIINEFRNVNKMYFDWLPLKDFYKLAKSVDLMISPACNEDLNYLVAPEQQKVHLDAKSPVKYTIAGAVGVPCIASPTREYAEAIKHGENGLIANDPNEFILYIEMMKNNKELRDSITKKAREDVEKNFNIVSRFPEYLAAITGDLTYKVKAGDDTNYIYIPPLAGGPRTFYTTLERYVDRMSGGEFKIVDNAFLGAKAGVIIAFYGLNECKAMKAKDPSFKIITRVDGLPMNFDGTLNQQQLELMKVSIQVADQVIWQSQHCKDIWASFVDVNKGVIIHNGADTEFFNKHGDKFSEIKSEKTKLLNVNFSTFKHKRIDILIDLIKNTPPEYHWYTMGQYLDTSVVNDQNMFKTYNNVTFFGPVASYSYEGREFLASVYRACDALVFTSEMEGSPNTVIEAASCGLPIIYNDSNSVVSEILGGFCIPVGNVESFQRALTSISNPDIVNTLKLGMEEKISKYTADIMAGNYLNVFKEVLGWESAKLST